MLRWRASAKVEFFFIIIIINKNMNTIPKLITLTDEIKLTGEKAIKIRNVADVIKSFSGFEKDLMKFCVYTGSAAANDLMASNNFKPADHDFFLINEEKMGDLCRFLMDDVHRHRTCSLSPTGCVLTFEHDGIKYQIINSSGMMKMLKKTEKECIALLISLFDTDYTKCAFYNGECMCVQDFLDAMNTRKCHHVADGNRRRMMRDRGFDCYFDNTVVRYNDYQLYEKTKTTSLRTKQGLLRFSVSPGTAIIKHNFNNIGKCYCETCNEIGEMTTLRGICAACFTKLYNCTIVDSIRVMHNDCISLKIGLCSKKVYEFKTANEAVIFCQYMYKNGKSVYEVINKELPLHPYFDFDIEITDKNKNIKIEDTIAKKIEHIKEKIGVDITYETWISPNVFKKSFHVLVTSHVMDMKENDFRKIKRFGIADNSVYHNFALFRVPGSKKDFKGSELGGINANILFVTELDKTVPKLDIKSKTIKTVTVIAPVDDKVIIDDVIKRKLESKFLKIMPESDLLNEMRSRGITILNSVTDVVLIDEFNKRKLIAKLSKDILIDEVINRKVTGTDIHKLIKSM